MGRSVTPTYRVEYRAVDCVLTSGSWWVHGRYQMRGDGRPTDVNLHEHVKSLEASFKPGRSNDHIGDVKIIEAWIVHQASGDQVAHYEAPLFEVIN
jgi:hypothetical protein